MSDDTDTDHPDHPWWGPHRKRLANAEQASESESDRAPLDTPLGRALAPLGASQALATALGRAKETVSRWKSGRNIPYLEDVPRIAHALAILYEEGVAGCAPTIMEILYPFGVPDGCERADVGGEQVRLEQMGDVLRLLGLTFEQRALGEGIDVLSDPWAAQVHEARAVTFGTAAQEVRSVLASFGLPLWQPLTREGNSEAKEGREEALCPEPTGE